jgi:hypothetical protein
MTYILSVLTPDAVLQASDRQATFVDERGRAYWADYETNKAVLFENRMAFASTGYAVIDGEPTADWLMERLAQGAADELTLEQRLDRVARHVGGFIRNLHQPPESKRHAFVGVGWRSEGDIRHAEAHLVSNSLDEQGHWLLAARNDFSRTVESLDRYAELAVLDAGVRVGPDVLDRHRARLGRPPELPAKVRTRIRRRHESGMSFATIADELNRDRVPTAHGGERWWPSSVRSVYLSVTRS